MFQIHDDRRIHLFTSFVFVLFLAILYFTMRTGVHTFDALSYVIDVENKPLLEVFHPHHLLYGPAGKMSVILAGWLGYNGQADQPIQALNAFAGALGILVLWHFGAGFTGKRWATLPLALLIAVSYAFWFYATEVEVYTLAALFIMLSLTAMSRLETSPSLQNTFFLGAATAGAVMFHQTNVMFAMPVSIYLLLDSRLRRYWVPYGLISGSMVAIPYLLIAFSSGLRTWSEFYRWAAGYTQTGQWGGYLSFEHMDALVAGLRNTVSPESALLAGSFYALVFFSVIASIARLIRHHEDAHWWGFVFGWVVLYGAFFWWWEPWNIEFWIVLLPAWGLLIFLGVRAIPEKGVWALSAIAAFIAIALFRAHYQPMKMAADPQHDYYRQMVKTLEPDLLVDDLIVTRGNILDLYLPYYAHHPPSNVLSMQYLHSQGDAFWALHARLRAASIVGQTVYLDQIILDEAASSNWHPFGISTEQIAVLKQDFFFEEQVSTEDETFFYVINPRSGNDAQQWEFHRSLKGWRAYGFDTPYYGEDGWCFQGGLDPWLVSAPLEMDTQQTTQVVLDISIDVEQEAQLFWQTTADFSEEQSISLSLEVGRKQYQISLNSIDGWEGVISRLRFDPVQDASGIESCLYSIRFITNS